MSLLIAYPNSQAVAHTLRAEVNARAYPKASARPYNLHLPATTVWWITPEPVWPAYRYGKFVIDPRLPGPPNVFVGLHLEKGPVHSDKREQRLGPDWIWHQFVHALRGTSISEFIHRIATLVKAPPHIRVLIHPPSDAEKPVEVAEQATFAVDNDSLLSVVAPQTRLSTYGAFRSVTNLPGLADALDAAPDSDWLWMWLQVVTKRSPPKAKPHPVF